MNMRCNYAGAKGFKNYGGRGIKVCEEWSTENKEGFKNFEKWMLEHGYDETLPRGAQTIDRIDCDGNYAPNNCRLISNFEQQANKRKNVFLTYKGETHHISEWARITGMSITVIRKRMNQGFDAEELFNKPLKNTNQKYNFEYQGKQYTSLTEVANDYGLSMKRLSYLIRRGRTVTEAIAETLLKK